MSATAVGFEDTRVARFWSATNGKKIVMAVSGVILFGFILGHLVGNLQMFAGPAPIPEETKINHYAVLLRSMPAVLWAVRGVLLLLVLLHIWCSFQLWLLKRRARPVAYVKKEPVSSTYASRTMYWSGPILGAFVIYHLMQFTFGTGGTPFDEKDVYHNVIYGFQVRIVSIFYIVALAMLCLHLYHGLWSMFQSVGVNHPRYTPLLRGLSKVVAVLIFAGYISIPVAVMAGVLR